MLILSMILSQQVQQQQEAADGLRTELRQAREMHHQECEQHATDNRMHEAQRTRIEDTIRQLEGSMMADPGQAIRESELRQQVPCRLLFAFVALLRSPSSGYFLFSLCCNARYPL